MIQQNDSTLTANQSVEAVATAVAM